MADLEHMLLEAANHPAGGTSGRRTQTPASRSGHSSKLHRRPGSYTDSSDSEGDNKYTKRKPSTSQVPLKKRHQENNNNKNNNKNNNSSSDSYNSGDDSDSAPSVGSDLYKDEYDKERLEKMSELDREMILAERSTRRDDYRLKKMARLSSNKGEKSGGRRDSSPPPPPPPAAAGRGGRSSARVEKSAAAKSALDELRAKRMRQQDPEAYRSRLKSLEGLSGNFTRRVGGGSPPSDGDDYAGDNKLDEDLLEDSPSRIDPLKFEDIREITIRRSRLVKWFMEPFFEELVPGCFVRLGLRATRDGRGKYKLCMIKNVDATEPDRTYKLENYTTCKYLNLVWDSESASARWEMTQVSDKPPQEEEFQEWLQAVGKSGARVPTRQEVIDKKEAIQRVNNFVYSAATVKQMLQEKKSASLRPVNIAAEKDRLRKELEIARARSDDPEADRILARLSQLEQLSRQPAQKDDKAARLAEMNRRNRVENFKNASELKPVNTDLKAGEAGYDPFSRRWTRSRNYYVSKPGDGSEPVPAQQEDKGKAEAQMEEEATKAALEAGKLVDTSAPVDQGTESNLLHNFEVPISLAALQKFGGPDGVYLGLMARKQRIEATVGYKVVPDNDGRRHALTLTVSDYKRRRGLL